MRSYKYKGVPDPSDIQLHKTAVGLMKKAKDKVQREKDQQGCSIFKYRNNIALNHEKKKLSQNVTVRDADLNRQFASLG